MPTFLTIYHDSPAARDRYKTATKEEFQASMEAWMAWKERSGDAVVDFGAPLLPGDAVPASDDAQIPSASGYSLLAAASREDAMALVEDHPHLDWAEGCQITLHQTRPMPG